MDSNHNNERFDEALFEGKLIGAKDVKNGLDCNCYCPACGTRVVAYNNIKNKYSAHFKHHSKRDCVNYYETLVHYQAKEIIAENKEFFLPKIDFSLVEKASAYDGGGDDAYYRTETLQKVNFDTVILEKRNGAIIPDITCSIGGKKLFIEIAVTHFIDEEKEKKIEGIGIPVIEINLKDVDRSIHKDTLKNIIYNKNEMDRVKWIYNPRIIRKESDVRSRTGIARRFLSENMQEIKVYGRRGYIYKCPIFPSKISVENKCFSCKCYIRHWEDWYDVREGGRPADLDEKIYCLGHKKDEWDSLILKLNDS